MPRLYSHRLYRPGTNVYIDPSILNIHRLSSLAGQIVTATTGMFYEALEPFEDQESFVPVIFQGKEYLVEEEYVSAD